MAPEERRRAIVAALVPVVLERGTDLSTKEIAQVAGVAEGTLFRAFPDKRSLVAAAVVEAARQHFAVVTSHASYPEVDLPPDATLADRLGVVVDRVLSRAGQSMRIITLLHELDPADLPEGGGAAFRPQHRFASGEEYLEHRAALAAWVTELLGEHASEIRVPIDQLIDIVRSMAIGGRVPPHVVSAPVSSAQIVDLLLHGVARTTAPEPTTVPRET